MTLKVSGIEDAGDARGVTGRGIEDAGRREGVTGDAEGVVGLGVWVGVTGGTLKAS